MGKHTLNSYYTDLVRTLDRLETAKKNLAESNFSPILIQDVKLFAKELFTQAKRILYLWDLLNAPEIHYATVQIVSRGPFVSKRINCGKCKKCTNRMNEYPHGPYLYFVDSNNKWYYQGKVSDYLTSDFLPDEYGKNLTHPKLIEIERNLEKLAEFREENHRLEALSNGGIEQ